MNEYFIILTTNKYPDGDAGAVRQHAFACLLKEIGFTPLVIGLGPCTNFKLNEFEGIKYYSFRYPKNDTISKAKSHLLFKFNLKKILKRYSTDEIKGILFVSGQKDTITFIKKFASKNDIQLYHDSVEWYSPCEFAKGEKAKGYIANNRLNTEFIDQNFKVFAISSFLEKHFESRNIHSLRVPVIMDTAKINYQKDTNPEFVKIVYAGQMGSKDKIFKFIHAIPLLSDEVLNKIKIFLIGMTPENFEFYCGKLEPKAKKVITFTGRIARNEVLKHLESADFTMLLRPEDERYAMAGFPTKVVESLSTATPVICNYTSDLKLYLKDGENSIIVEDTSAESCANALKKAVSLTAEERKIMQNNARKTAEKEFDYRVYTDKVKEFIS